MKTKAVLWLKAARVKFYILIMLPVLVGSLIAFSKTGSFNVASIAVSELVAVLVVMASIFANNYADADHDKENRTFNILSGHVPADVEGRIPKNSMLFATVLLSVLALLSSCIYPLVFRAHAYIPLFAAAGLVAGFQYSYAPAMVNRRGLGEIFIALMASLFCVFFGFVTQAGFRLPLKILCYAAPIGIGMFLVMLSAEMSDYEGDKAAGKLTIPIIFGKETALRVYFVSLILMYGSIIALFFASVISTNILAWILVSMPMAVYAGAHSMHKPKYPPKFAINICGVTKLLYMWVNIILAFSLLR
jgi:1,4-dihydroxy-2-naphthoate octaprenyltransferase